MSEDIGDPLDGINGSTPKLSQQVYVTEENNIHDWESFGAEHPAPRRSLLGTLHGLFLGLFHALSAFFRRL
jgi:hypothetical protein